MKVDKEKLKELEVNTQRLLSEMSIGYTDSEWEEMLKTHTDEQVMNKLFIWLSLNNRIKFEI